MRVRPAGRPAGGLGGRLAITLFGAVFLIAGLAGTAFIGREALGVVRAWTAWVRTSCTIVDSGASLDGGEEHPYRFEVRYRYRWRGGVLEGTTFQEGYVGSADFRPVQKLLLAYPPGRSAACFVDPGDPSQAVLKRRSPAFVLVILFPLLFVALGTVIIVAAWSGRSRPTAVEALGRGSSSAVRGRRLAGIVFGVFLAVGLGGAAALTPWMLGPLRARSWVEVPAKVLSSKVRRHTSSNGNGGTSVTWKLDILYAYTYDGVSYHSNRYGFFNGSSSGRASKVARARRYRPGAIIRVHVDPRDPTRAVIVPGYTAEHLLFLIPLLALVIGAVGLRWNLRAPPGGLRGLTPKDAMEEGVSPEPAAPEGPLELKARGVRIKKAAIILLFAAFWNGMVAVFVWRAVQGFTHGRPDWPLALFLVPFVLVGLVLAAGFLHALLALANPRTVLTVDHAAPRLGETLRLEWRTAGTVGRLRSFRIVLEGREEATYRRGTDTMTDREVFARFEIVRTGSPLEIRRGEAEFEIPGDTMHSFSGASNEIVWELKVEGEIPRWPDVADSWPLKIRPMAPGGRTAWTV